METANSEALATKQKVASLEMDLANALDKYHYSSALADDRQNIIAQRQQALTGVKNTLDVKEQELKGLAVKHDALQQLHRQAVSSLASLRSEHDELTKSFRQKDEALLAMEQQSTQLQDQLAATSEDLEILTTVHDGLQHIMYVTYTCLTIHEGKGSWSSQCCLTNGTLIRLRQCLC